MKKKKRKPRFDAYARCCGNVVEKWALCRLKLLENCGRKSGNESGVRPMRCNNKSV